GRDVRADLMLRTRGLVEHERVVPDAGAVLKDVGAGGAPAPPGREREFGFFFRPVGARGENWAGHLCVLGLPDRRRSGLVPRRRLRARRRSVAPLLFLVAAEIERREAVRLDRLDVELAGEILERRAVAVVGAVGVGAGELVDLLLAV